MVSRRKRSNSSVGNKLNNLTDRVTEQQKLQQVSGTQTNAVTNDSIALGAVNTESVADRSITSNKIGRGEVTSDNLGVINEIVASGGLDIETGVDGHLSLSGGKYEAPYDGVENADGYMTVAFDPTDNAIKIIDNAVTAGSFGSATAVGTFTVDAQGRLTLAGNTTIAPPLTNLSDVDITSVATGQTLIHNGTNFVNTTPPSYNYIINGAFDIWQRGTSFASAVNGAFSADRYIATYNGTGVRTISREAFTLGAAPEAGYEGTYFYRYNQTSAGTGGSVSNVLEQKIEGVRTLANEAITISFWAKADATRTVTPIMTQYFGTGGSPSSSVATNGSAKTLTTSWARYTATVTLPSISGKTVGTAGDDSLILTLQSSTVNATQTIDIWGVQVEEGSIATPFRRNAPSIQAELAACQRYYQRIVAKQAYAFFGTGVYNTTTAFYMPIHLPVDLRVIPAFSYGGGVRILTAAGETISALTIYAYSSTNPVSLAGTSSATGSDGYAAVLGANNDAAAYLEFDAEL